MNPYPRDLGTPQLRTSPAVAQVLEMFSGKEIRPHILHHAFHPRLIEAVPDRADRRDGADLGESFPVSHGGELRSGIRRHVKPSNRFPRDHRAISNASSTIVVR